MRGMTKAIYKIKNTFEEMGELHHKEIENHQHLIVEFRHRAEKTRNYQERLICLLEAHRNREHQKGHERMVEIYSYLDKTFVRLGEE